MCPIFGNTLRINGLSKILQYHMITNYHRRAVPFREYLTPTNSTEIITNQIPLLTSNTKSYTQIQKTFNQTFGNMKSASVAMISAVVMFLCTVSFTTGQTDSPIPTGVNGTGNPDDGMSMMSMMTNGTELEGMAGCGYCGNYYPFQCSSFCGQLGWWCYRCLPCYCECSNYC
ncbi:hypothetical protein Fcan01_10512 [Folsomia candida]|uniref:Uncharacterized protein n=1 Tax=Folsomia candida TaxID=158441 RepID=A0A226EAK1_FOLCA|nr:hypothetical protein Fcan01_10512 [Folsomia candida]